MQLGLFILKSNEIIVSFTKLTNIRESFEYFWFTNPLQRIAIVWKILMYTNPISNSTFSDSPKKAGPLWNFQCTLLNLLFLFLTNTNIAKNEDFASPFWLTIMTGTSTAGMNSCSTSSKPLRQVLKRTGNIISLMKCN